MPDMITEEKPAKNLASLVTSSGLTELRNVLTRQWVKSTSFADLHQYGIRPLDRALFFGPPGNGKTMAAQVIANELDCPLYRVQCEALISAYLGSSAKNMATCLDWIESQGRAVVLFDECETLFPDRSASGTGACSRDITSAMQIFWQRLDRWETPQLFLLATNMIDRIDGALISRIELQLEFGPPKTGDAIKVIDYWQEVLHEYGAGEWGEALRQQVIANDGAESYRALWHAIVSYVRMWVTDNAEREA